jgi:hypothetical protein
MIETVCKRCGNRKSFSEDKFGKKFKCPNCGNVVQIEEALEAESPLPIIENSTQQRPTQNKSSLNKGSKKKIIITAFVVIGLVVITGTWWGYNKYYNAAGYSDLDTISNPLVPEIPVIDNTTSSDKVIKSPKESTSEQPTSESKSSNKVDQDLTKQEQTQQSALPKEEIKTVNDNITKVILAVGRDEDPKRKSPKAPTKLVIQIPTMIVRITTDHFNEGMGTTGAGTISIKDESGKIMGTFNASGISGINGTPNGKWVSEPHKILGKGTYFVFDSDMSTWPKNFVGMGFILIEGYTMQ